MMSANLRAFLALIRWAEGTSGPDGYRTIVGGELFDSFDDHPRKIRSGVFHTGVPWTSTAAGAYQFLSSTWDRAARALDLPDFSPESQDKAAVWLIQERRALQDVEAGNLETALSKCSWEWASLPPSRYGQPTKSLEACTVIFERAGGIVSQAPPSTITAGAATGPTAPAPSTQAAGTSPDAPSVPLPPSPAAAPPALSQEIHMPLPAAAAVALAAELWRILRPTPKVEAAAGAIEKAAPVLLGTAKEVVPTAVNEQQAVERIKSDPQAQAQFRAAAMLRWDDLAPAWEAEEKSRREAREFGAEMTGTGPVWRQIGAGLLIGALSLTIILGGGVLFWQMLESPQLDPGQKGLVLGALLAAFTSAVGYWFGSSASGRLKDQTIADQARR